MSGARAGMTGTADEEPEHSPCSLFKWLDRVSIELGDLRELDILCGGWIPTE